MHARISVAKLINCFTSYMVAVTSGTRWYNSSSTNIDLGVFHLANYTATQNTAFDSFLISHTDVNMPLGLMKSKAHRLLGKIDKTGCCDSFSASRDVECTTAALL